MAEASSPPQDRSEATCESPIVENQCLNMMHDYSLNSENNMQLEPSEESKCTTNASQDDQQTSILQKAQEINLGLSGQKRKYSQLGDIEHYPFLSASNWKDRTETLRDVEGIHSLYKYKGSEALSDLLLEAKSELPDESALEFIKEILTILPALPLKCDELAFITNIAKSLQGLGEEINSSLSALTDVVDKTNPDEHESSQNEGLSLQENEKIIISALEHNFSRKLPRIKKIFTQRSSLNTLKSSLKPPNPDKTSPPCESKRVSFAKDEDLVQVHLFEPHPDEISHQHFYPTRFPKLLPSASALPSSRKGFVPAEYRTPGNGHQSQSIEPVSHYPQSENLPAPNLSCESSILPAGVPINPHKDLPPGLAEPPTFPPPSADLLSLMKIIPQNDPPPNYPGAEPPYGGSIHPPHLNSIRAPTGAPTPTLHYNFEDFPKEKPPDLSPDDLFSNLFSLVQSPSKGQPTPAVDPMDKAREPHPTLINSILLKIIDLCAPLQSLAAQPSPPPPNTSRASVQPHPQPPSTPRTSAQPLPQPPNIPRVPGQPLFHPYAGRPNPGKQRFRGRQRKSSSRERHLFNPPKHHLQPPGGFISALAPINQTSSLPLANNSLPPSPNASTVHTHQGRSVWGKLQAIPPAPHLTQFDRYYAPQNTTQSPLPQPAARATGEHWNRNLPKLRK